MIEAILSPCLEDVAGVACDTGAGAASSTSPWDFAKNQPFLQRAETKNYATAEFTKITMIDYSRKKCCVLRRLLVEK